jgi:hypothetical protein
MTASHPDTAGSVRSRRIDAATLSRLGLLAAAAVAVYVFEGVLPMPLPWARLGLSNAVTVVVLFSFGFGSALAVNVVQVLSVPSSTTRFRSPSLPGSLPVQVSPATCWASSSCWGWPWGS